MFAFYGLRMRAGPDTWEPSSPPPRVGTCLDHDAGQRRKGAALLESLSELFAGHLSGVSLRR
jgi:hypothetical protein